MKITAKKDLHDLKRISPQKLVDTILEVRGITDTKTFLKPASPLSLGLTDFGYTKEYIQKVYEFLVPIYEAKKPVIVYTDYDADGITGGAILWETMHYLGFHVMPYVPDRKTEGYGFSKVGIDSVKEKYNPAAIISVDHGITAKSQIEYAKELGIPVIVTDHHHKQEEKIPEAAVAIFHIPVLSGSATAYFFAKELYTLFAASHRTSIKHMNTLEKHFQDDYLALATIGTIADLVPLVGVSRSVVSHGLEAFSRVKRPGLASLIKQADIEGKTISPYEIGFIIAPRINAVGRLTHAIDALRLLCTTKLDKAEMLAQKVGGMNIKRQDLVKESVEEAIAMVEQKVKEETLGKIIILYTDHWNEGIIGLIASKLVEKYYRPTIIMTRGDGHYKGSARSILSFHITHFFEDLKEYFVNFGGHAQAAGFSLPHDKLEGFLDIAVAQATLRIKDEDLVRELIVDLKVPLAIHSISLTKSLDVLHPFGIGNPQPTFMTIATLKQVSIMGKTGSHLRLTIEHDGQTLEIVAFGKADVFSSLEREKTYLVAYQIDINAWNGRESLQGKLLGIIDS